MREDWSLLVKPTHACNLNCKYCYDKPFRDKYGNIIMSVETVDKIAKLASQFARKIQWIWHGGEPTIVGVEWYRKIQDVFYKYYNTKWEQNMQTNGLLLNKDWVKLSKDYDIQIGVSFDIFNQEDTRIGKDSNQKKLEEILKMFEDENCPIGTITVVNRKNYKMQIEMYEYIKKNFHFSPAFNHLYRSKGTLKNNLEITAEEYAKEFLKYFKYWLYDTDERAREERSVSEILQHVSGSRDKLTCTWVNCVHDWIGVSPNGDIYPCDRYVPNKYYMGNIHDYDSIEEVYNSKGHRLYVGEYFVRINVHCKECGYLPYCNGGCNGNHIAVSGSNSGLDEFSCKLFKLKFNGVYDILRGIDIYKEKYNINFIKVLIENPLITVKEIKDFLKMKGINKELEYNPKGKELFNCSEFKMFRIFNQFKGEENGHVDFTNYELKRDVILRPKFDMNILKANRLKLMNIIYQDNLEKIEKILNS